MLAAISGILIADLRFGGKGTEGVTGMASFRIAPLILVAGTLAWPAWGQERPSMPRPSDEELLGMMDPGDELEVRFDGDINGDGDADLAWIERGDDTRKLVVLIGYRSEVEIGHQPPSQASLDPFPLGPAALSVKGNVLIVEDLTGGTSATVATYRYRWDPAELRMRLIGLDAKFYSRTNNHGWNSISWNLLTGNVIEERAELVGSGENASYAKPVAKRSSKPVTPVYMEDTPNAEELVIGQ